MEIIEYMKESNVSAIYNICRRHFGESIMAAVTSAGNRSAHRVARGRAGAVVKTLAR